MIEWLGFFYGLAKDLGNYLKYQEETKLVDGVWLKESGFQDHAEQKGFELKWSRPDKVQSKLLNGWEIMYEVDKLKRVRRRIERRDGNTLIGKAKSKT